MLKRGENKPVAVPAENNDTFVEELEEFANAAARQRQARGRRRFRHNVAGGDPRGVLSAREGRRVEVAEILKTD